MRMVVLRTVPHFEMTSNTQIYEFERSFMDNSNRQASRKIKINKKEQAISRGCCIVSGASLGSVNGAQYRIGEDDGHPIYSKIGDQNSHGQSCALINIYISYNGSCWQFFARSSTYLNKGQAKGHVYYNIWLWWM